MLANSSTRTAVECINETILVVDSNHNIVRETLSNGFDGDIADEVENNSSNQSEFVDATHKNDMEGNIINSQILNERFLQNSWANMMIRMKKMKHLVDIVTKMVVFNLPYPNPKRRS